MTFDGEVLNRLVPALSWEPDWSDVLGRAGELERRRPWQLRGKRRLILVFTVLAVLLLIPLIALGAASWWWFFKYGQAPTPVSPPVVVKEGSWDGQPWELVAYRSTTEDLCYSVTPAGSEVSGAGAAMACGPFAGIVGTNETKATPDMTISALVSSGGQLPVNIAGPVVDSASQVEITFSNGQVLRVPTFAAPTSIGSVRFYAAPLPEGVSPSLPRSVAGLDDDGNVVACLVLAAADNGISPLSACE
jgi:hypothetical protein